MEKSVLLEKINAGDFDKKRLLTWITALPGNTKSPNTPTKFKSGDVLKHSIFKHPYVLLEKTDKFWVCGLLTSDKDCSEILESCNSRFYSDSFFTRVLFTETDPPGAFHGVFENKAQIDRVLKSLRETLK